MVVLLGWGRGYRPTRVLDKWTLNVRPLVCNDRYPWISANDHERRYTRRRALFVAFEGMGVLDLTGGATAARMYRPPLYFRWI
jgi:hypothetical protein